MAARLTLTQEVVVRIHDPETKNAPLVQLVEHRTFNAVVRSSNLRRRTIWENAGVWSNGADCKFVALGLRWFKSNFSHQLPFHMTRL